MPQNWIDWFWAGVWFGLGWIVINFAVGFVKSTIAKARKGKNDAV